MLFIIIKMGLALQGRPVICYYIFGRRHAEADREILAPVRPVTWLLISAEELTQHESAAISTA